MEFEEKTVQRTEIYQGPIFKVVQDQVELPEGKGQAQRDLIFHNGAVAVIAITPENKMILVKQYRKAIEATSYEIPAGKLEVGENADPHAAALRELEEETGYTGGKWEEIMTIAPNPGVMDNLCHCFYARGVKKTSNQHLDETEDIDVFLCPKEEVKQMLLRGEFIQALMVAPLWKYFSIKD